MTATYSLLNDDTWRECASWLTQWGIIRHDHKANWSESSISDLANALRDGVLLCKLANKICPGSVDMKNVSVQHASAQFLCQRNINLFLQACKQNFGLKGPDLFDDIMLFKMTDFHKVLLTLSKLSLSNVALKSGIQGFSAQVETTSDDEEIYQRLQKDKPPVTDIRESIIDSYVVDAEEIYQDLLEIRSKIKHPEIKNKKDFPIKEIYDTEQNYLAFLSKLMNRYMLPLQKKMSSNAHACVFHKIRELYDLHSPFLIELNKVKTNPQKIGHIFLQYINKFVIYGSYCANLTKATNLLQELCDQDESFSDAVVGLERQVDRGKFRLQDLLKVPMQRVLKYDLLLGRVLHEADKSQKEYEELSQAKEMMLDVANVINEEVRDAEHLNMLNNLQDTITEWVYEGDLRLSDYGKLIKDVELRIRDPTSSSVKKRYVFIFNKCILICKQAKGHLFAFRDIIKIMDYSVTEVDNESIFNTITQWRYNFSLVKNDDSVMYTFFVQTMEFKEQIIDIIKESQDKIQPETLIHTKHNLKLQTFHTLAQCGHCNKFLKGLIFQGYICKNCQISLHKECIEFSKKCGKHTRSSNRPNNISDHDSLRDKLWYVGEMDRRTAQKALSSRENGTFLVRIGKVSYTITLRTDTAIENMLISTTMNGPSNSKKYCLSGRRQFNTLEELIVYYENYSLKENFDRFEEQTKLLYPFHQLRARVIRDFESKDQYQLSVREGQVLSVIGKEGYRQGFWKGRTNDNRIGYFPATVVSLEGEVRFDNIQ